MTLDCGRYAPDGPRQQTGFYGRPENYHHQPDLLLPSACAAAARRGVRSCLATLTSACCADSRHWRWSLNHDNKLATGGRWLGFSCGGRWADVGGGVLPPFPMPLPQPQHGIAPHRKPEAALWLTSPAGNNDFFQWNTFFHRFFFMVAFSLENLGCNFFYCVYVSLKHKGGFNHELTFKGQKTSYLNKCYWLRLVFLQFIKLYNPVWWCHKLLFIATKFLYYFFSHKLLHCAYFFFLLWLCKFLHLLLL